MSHLFIASSEIASSNLEAAKFPKIELRIKKIEWAATTQLMTEFVDFIIIQVGLLPSESAERHGVD